MIDHADVSENSLYLVVFKHVIVTYVKYILTYLLQMPPTLLQLFLKELSNKIAFSSGIL
jgi:hypothetical protein